MTAVAITLLFSGVLAMGLARPLIQRKIGMNELYGVRIPEAFESEERWYAINAYGGRCLFRWGIFVALLGVAGLFFDDAHLAAYGIATTVLTLSSLGVTVGATYLYAARTRVG